MAEWIVKENGSGLPDDMFLEASKGCYSIENHAAHGIENLSASPVGIIYAARAPEYLYEIYRGTGNTYWYKTLIETKDGRIPVSEYLFGHSKWERRRRKADHIR